MARHVTLPQVLSAEATLHPVALAAAYGHARTIEELHRLGADLDAPLDATGTRALRVAVAKVGRVQARVLKTIGFYRTKYLV